MKNKGDFKLIFSKLYNLLERETDEESIDPQIKVRLNPQATREEMEQIDEIRRVVLEVTDPEPMSFTTT